MTVTRIYLTSGTSWSTVVIVALTIAATLGGILIAERAETRRWNAAQIGLVNASRAERLRMIYARLVQAAATLQAVVHERGYLVGDETEAERDKRHNAQVTGAFKLVSEVGER